MSKRERNEGEGNKTADRRFRESSRKFVDSARGRERIEHAGDLTEEEAAGGERAERAGKARAREFGPATGQQSDTKSRR